ncbi:MAG: hypothetical protein HYY31_01780 [Chloroflexi bacterium]|nr:hypothetical protein [Chloroflexota bacterium]
MDRARAICQELLKAGIHHLVWLPDSETHFMHEAMHSTPGLQVTQVCKEGEAVAVCTGLHLGGSKGALLVENQGMFEYGNVLKWAIGLRIPLVMLIGYLQYYEMTRRDEGMFLRGQKDFTEPFLDAFGISYSLVENDGDVPKVGQACREAYEKRMPVAVLLTSADAYEPGT